MSYTTITDYSLTGSRKWIESAATIRKVGDRWFADAVLPEGTSACFIKVKNKQLIATSDYHEIT